LFRKAGVVETWCDLYDLYKNHGRQGLERYWRNLRRLSQNKHIAKGKYWAYYFNKEKLLDDQYVENAILLAESGFPTYDGGLFSAIEPAKGRSREFIEVLIYLHQNGVGINRPYTSDGTISADSFLAGFTLAQAREKEYLDTLIALAKRGVEIDMWLLYLLTLEKGVNPLYRKALLRLHDAGVESIGRLVSYLSVEKAEDQDFISFIVRVVEESRKRGVQPGLKIQSIVERFHPGSLPNDEYVQLLIQHNLNPDDTDLAYLLKIRKDRKELIDFLFSFLDESTWRVFWEEAFALSNTTYIGLLGRIVSWMREEKDKTARDIIAQHFQRLVEKPASRMNELHERSDRERLAEVEGANPETLYYILALAREAYTSTTNLLSQKLKEEMKRAGIDLFGLLDRADPDMKYLSQFVYALAQYDRLFFVMEGMDEKSTRKLFSFLFQQIEKSKNKLEHAFYLGAGLGAVLAPSNGQQQNNSYARILTEELFEWAGRFWNKEKKESGLLLRILISLWAERFSGSYREKAFLLRNEYRVAAGDLINPAELVDGQGVFHQRMYFYDDSDGRASFNSFLNQRRLTGWKIEDKKDFVIVSRKTAGGQTLREIRIYANKPGTNNVDLDLFLNERKIVVRAVIHRGHSYHVSNTLHELTGKEKMISLGSCGGFREVDAILEKNQDMLIFSTSNIGTMAVNDPLLNAIDLALLDGKTNLRAIWQEAMAKISDPRKTNYIPPYDNIGPKIYKAFRKYAPLIGAAHLSSD